MDKDKDNNNTDQIDDFTYFNYSNIHWDGHCYVLSIDGTFNVCDDNKNLSEGRTWKFRMNLFYYNIKLNNYNIYLINYFIESTLLFII